MQEDENEDGVRPTREDHHLELAYKRVFPGSWMVIIALLIVVGILVAFLIS